MRSRKRVVRYVAAALLAATAFACAAATTTISFAQLGARQDRARTLVGAILAEQAAFVALIDEETGVRGYVATGDPVYLEPYDHGRRAYAAYRARPPAAPDPAVASSLERFRRAADDLQPFFRTQVDAVASGRRERAIAAFPAGKTAFDRLRRIAAVTSSASIGALNAERLELRATVRAAQFAMIVMAVVLIGAGTLATMLTIRARSSDALARRDDLTRLPNRLAFEERLGATLAEMRPGELFGVLYIDLDKFKPVNDRLGHAAGDQVLAACGERLQRSIRPSDFVARLGGDEFAAILALDTVADADAIVERIERAIEAPFAIAGATVQLSASIGVAIVPVDGIESRAIVRAADEAMYAVKRERRAAAS